MRIRIECLRESASRNAAVIASLGIRDEGVDLYRTNAETAARRR